jgi:hypothetical protein
MARTRTPWFPSFWQIQSAAWTVLYVLLIVAALPHLREPAILSYNTVGCAMCFCASLLLRPICRGVYERWFRSWVVLEAFAFALSMVGGTIVTFCWKLQVEQLVPGRGAALHDSFSLVQLVFQRQAVEEN